MKCPWRQIKTLVDLSLTPMNPRRIEKTDYADCYGIECPWYSFGEPERCRRTRLEEESENDI